MEQLDSLIPRIAARLCHRNRTGTDRVAQISSDDSTALPSRLVICDCPLAELVPLYANPESGFPTTKMTIAQIADAGFVQFNAINQNALTVIQCTVQEIAKSGTTINIDNIALDNNGAYRLLSAGEAHPITLLDDEHYKSALSTVQPDQFKDLCAVIALSQPHLQGCIPLFVERKRNPELIHYFHTALESITAETFGLILYQEQVMHIAHKIAGFSLAQGDTFRRAIKNPNREAVCIHKQPFIDGAINFGLPQAEATGLFEHIAIPNQLYFNKSHAVAYAMVAYQTAWLKANYSHEFIKTRTRYT